MITTLLIILGALFAAVIGRTILDPWPSPTTVGTEDQAISAERAARTMNAITLSSF